jgi:prepilin-type N-terminal cleavage/methylation domain-containing protein
MKIKMTTTRFTVRVKQSGNLAKGAPGSAHRAARASRGFTLIELLTVIAVIGVLAGLLIPAGLIMVRHSIISRAQSEMGQLETAIQGYYSKYGYYPPGNSGGAVTNQLYYELLGTAITNNGGTISYATLDNGSTINSNNVSSIFGVSAFMNCTRGGGEDSVPAKTFLFGLKSGEIATVNNSYNIIVTAANSDSIYTPLPGVFSQAGRPANPWRYLYPGTNNPGSYDLWVQIYVGGKTNLICNWFNQPKLNNPLP